MIVDLYKSKVKTPRDISEEYNILIANIYAWTKVEKVKNHKNTSHTPEQLELIKLKEKLKIKEMENEILKKSVVIFYQQTKNNSFMRSSRRTWKPNKTILFELINIGKTQFYYHMNNPINSWVQDDDKRTQLIFEIFNDHNGNLGSPRIKIEYYLTMK